MVEGSELVAAPSGGVTTSLQIDDRMSMKPNTATGERIHGRGGDNHL